MDDFQPVAVLNDARFDPRLVCVSKPRPGVRMLYRLLILLALAPPLLIVILGIQLQPDIAEAVPESRPPDFAEIKTRFRRVRMWQTHKQVEQLLGPPTERFVDDPALREAEQRFENAGRNPMPTLRVWDRWSDPQDASRWVAILYEGNSVDGTVYYTYKKGL